MNKPIDKSKLIEWIDTQISFSGDLVPQSLTELQTKINSGEFDCEVVGGEPRRMTYKERMDHRNAIEKVNGSQRAYKN